MIRPAEAERREAQVKDPYPDSLAGPETGFRPLDYQEQRSEPLQAKDRYLTSMFRIRRTPQPFGQTYLPPPPVVYAPPVYMPHQPPMAVYPPPIVY